MNSKISKAINIGIKIIIASVFAFLFLFNISIITNDDGWSIQVVKDVFGLPVPCVEGSPDWPDCDGGGGYNGGGSEILGNYATYPVNVPPGWYQQCFRIGEVQRTMRASSYAAFSATVPGIGSCTYSANRDEVTVKVACYTSQYSVHIQTRESRTFKNSLGGWDWGDYWPSYPSPKCGMDSEWNSGYWMCGSVPVEF